MHRQLSGNLLIPFLLAFHCVAQTSPSVQAKDPAVKLQNSAAPLLADADACLIAGKFDAAAAKYLAILKVEPNMPAAYSGLTRAYLKQGKVKDAYDTISQGLKVANDPGERVALGEVHFRQGKIVDAEKEWVDVINTGHPVARAYLGLARVRHAISQYKQSKLMIDKAYQLDPTDPDIQSDWVATLSLNEQIQKLELFLTEQKDSSDENRSKLQRQLDYMKARQKAPGKSCQLSSHTTSTETPLAPLLLDAEHLRGYGLTVVINGKKTLLMLDSGASGILIDRGIAHKAGVTKLSDTRIGGIGDRGDSAGYMGVAETIRIGELEFQNCPVQVLDRHSVMGDSGLIGLDVFEEFLVDLNFPQRKLRLQELPKRPDESDHLIALNSDSENSGHDGGMVKLRAVRAQLSTTGTSRPRCVPIRKYFVLATCCFCLPKSMTPRPSFS